MKKTTRIIISTGGTGGHIFPALAVAHELQKHPHMEVVFVGARNGKEEILAKKAGLTFYGLDVQGVKGKGLRGIKAAFQMIQALKQSRNILQKVDADAVIGFGGYASFPTVLAAKFCRIPSLIHEQNVIPGTANKILSHFVQKICLSFPDSYKSFNPHKTVVTGNPIREEISAISPQDSLDYKAKHPEKHLFVMGGSLGAKAINSVVVELLHTLRDSSIGITHQCGEQDYARMYEAYKSHGFSHEQINTMLFPFIENMAEAYIKADLVLCRAGATSLTELTAVGKPSLLIPFPHAIHDHQTLNAKAMEAEGAAIHIPEYRLKNLDMPKIILELLSNKEKLTHMAEANLSLANLLATKNVAKQIITIIQQNKREREKDYA